MKFVDNMPDVLQREDRLLIDNLMTLPQKIQKHHHVDGLVEMVLHELSHQDCFGLKKATYIIDNPDFDCLCGIAGFCTNECTLHKENIWENPLDFSKDMKEASFHQKIRSFIDKSSVRKKPLDVHNYEDIHLIAQSLGIESPSFCRWETRQGNHACLIYERDGALDSWRQHLLNNFAMLLSMCPLA